MLFSTPKALRLPSVKRMFVPAPIRKRTNVVPSGYSVAARGGRTARRVATRTVRSTAR